MTEGTKSVLFGAHSVMHSILVTIAWRQTYGVWPTLKELVCIFVHDIGYIGKNYLTDKSNEGHAELGAKIVGWLFGDDYRDLVLGHSSSAQRKYGLPPSKLEAPDDYSWVIAPLIWLRWNGWVEKFGLDPVVWKQVMTDKVKNGDTRPATEVFHSAKTSAHGE